MSNSAKNIIHHYEHNIFKCMLTVFFVLIVVFDYKWYDTSIKIISACTKCGYFKSVVY